MGIKSFNFCSVKVYHSYINDKGEKINKATSWHANTLYKADSTVGTNNFLQPNTPVAILSFGDEIFFGFEGMLMEIFYSLLTNIHTSAVL